MVPLRQSIANETHSTKFAGDEHAGNVRFEVGTEHRDVDATSLGTEYQRDRIERTGCPAGTVPDAITRPHQCSLAADQSQHGVLRLLGAGHHAGAATQAAA